jgi:hypothetical protein
MIGKFDVKESKEYVVQLCRQLAKRVTAIDGSLTTMQ